MDSRRCRQELEQEGERGTLRPEEGLSELVQVVYKSGATYSLICVKLVSLMQSQH